MHLTGGLCHFNCNISKGTTSAWWSPTLHAIQAYQIRVGHTLGNHMPVTTPYTLCQTQAASQLALRASTSLAVFLIPDRSELHPNPP
jgi:hypothetical protein